MSPASLTVWPADGVHFAWIGRDIVTLDLGRDAYGLLTDAADRIRPGPSRRILLDDPDNLAPLVDAGLVTTIPRIAAQQKSVLPPTHALLPGEGGDVGLAARLIAAVNAVEATIRFRRRSLGALLGDAAVPQPVRATPAPVQDLYAAFDAILPWIPWEGECLQRAFMLHRHLVKAGQPALWVIGVRTWPFLAHAWVQVGSEVVGDSLERVRTFEPILAV